MISFSYPNVFLAASLGSLIFCFLIHKRPIRGDTALLLEIGWTSALFVFLSKSGYESSTSLSLSFKAFIVHALTVICGTIAYRLSPFHPLWRFPGPVLNRITSLRLAYIVWTGKRHEIIKALHDEYGRIVRTGPNMLSINAHSAVAPIYAQSTAFPKSEAYVMRTSAGAGLFFMTDMHQHNMRRKIWAGGFSSECLATYKDALENRCIQLMDCMASRRDSNGSINALECIQHWSYDVMGDVTFGKSNKFELMHNGDAKQLVRSGQLATVWFEIVGEVPSLFDIMSYLPVTDIFKALEKTAASFIETRRDNTSAETNDLATYILQEKTKGGSKLPVPDLHLDALFAIQAGSDTTTGIAVFLIYYILANPDVYERLRHELDEVFSDPSEPFPSGVLERLPYLNALVNESLRLGTPFPGLPRVVPKAGAVLDGVYVPGDTIVGVPAYSQAIDEENFWPDPLSFKPERWLPGGLCPGSRANKNALMAFSFGTYGCLGRALAIQELRVLAARLLVTYDIKLAPDFDHKRFLDGVLNMRTTLFEYPLNVVATPRVQE